MAGFGIAIASIRQACIYHLQRAIRAIAGGFRSILRIHTVLKLTLILEPERYCFKSTLAPSSSANFNFDIGVAA